MTAAFPSGKCLKCVLSVGKTGIKEENKVTLGLSGMWKSFWAGSEYTSIVQQKTKNSHVAVLSKQVSLIFL